MIHFDKKRGTLCNADGEINGLNIQNFCLRSCQIS